MKIILATIFQVPNYGSVLQTFATQIVLENMGGECDIINYKYPNEWHWRHGAIKPCLIKSIIRRFFPKEKEQKLNDFRKQFLHLTKMYDSLDELRKETWDGYDAFVVGSDQVWNSKFLLGDSFFMLSFAPKDKPRYSIASSFAISSLPNEYRAKYKQNLSLFSAISVRESKGVGIINKELGIDKSVDVILDPTLLLTRGEWLSLIPRSNFVKKRPYILFYMWTYAFEPRPFIFEVTKYFQEKLDCDVIALEGYCNVSKANGLHMIDKSSASIPEFIDLFANADMVITSSFHGTAFALNFGIPLVSIIPNNGDDDRQSTIVRAVGVEHTLATNNTIISTINPKYDFECEQQKLEILRNESKLWLHKNIFI